MSRLTAGMYDGKSSNEETLFGLHSGQGEGSLLWRLMWALFRELVVPAGSRWYNKAGEKLGHGALGKLDVLAIHNGLKEDEVFVVLPEPVANEDPKHRLFLAQYCHFIFCRKGMFMVLPNEGAKNLRPPAVYIHGLFLPVIGRSEAALEIYGTV